MGHSAGYYGIALYSFGGTLVQLATLSAFVLAVSSIFCFLVNSNFSFQMGCGRIEFKQVIKP